MVISISSPYNLAETSHGQRKKNKKTWFSGRGRRSFGRGVVQQARAVFFSEAQFPGAGQFLHDRV